MIDGALLLDKPAGISSNGALQEAKRLLGARKGGHAGTLDPLASGLLLLLFGEATKCATLLLEDDKEYEAGVKLGERTSTGDAEGAVIESGEGRVAPEAVLAALERFKGDIEQVPPMHSALKRDGVPLYALARRGEQVERAARRVHVSELQPLSIDPPWLRLRVRCSKGTYIRTLAEDIGAALGTVAHLASLRRTGSGRFRLADAITLDALRALPAAERASRLLPLEALLAGLPRAELDPQQEARFRNGQPVRGVRGTGVLAVFDARGAVIGLGRADHAGLQPLRQLAVSQAADKHRKTL